MLEPPAPRGHRRSRDRPLPPPPVPPVRHTVQTPTALHACFTLLIACTKPSTSRHPPAVAALAALLLLAAGAAAAPAAPADACGVDCSSTFVPALFGACLLGVNANATVLPSIDVAAWDQARRWVTPPPCQDGLTTSHARAAWATASAGI